MDDFDGGVDTECDFCGNLMIDCDCEDSDFDDSQQRSTTK